MSSEPLTRQQWVNAFVDALTRIRPGVGLRLAATVAAHEWVAHQTMSPEAAAKQWAATRKPITE